MARSKLSLDLVETCDIAISAALIINNSHARYRPSVRVSVVQFDIDSRGRTIEYSWDARRNGCARDPIQRCERDASSYKSLRVTALIIRAVRRFSRVNRK